MIPRFTLWLEFEHWTPEPGDDPEDDFFNMKVVLDSGKTYALNVWTFKFMERRMWAVRDGTAEDLDRKHSVEREYMHTPDLLVARMDRKLIEKVVGHLLEQYGGRLLREWECSEAEK